MLLSVAELRQWRVQVRDQTTPAAPLIYGSTFDKELAGTEHASRPAADSTKTLSTKIASRIQR